MATIIPPELEQFVEREISSGKFRSREEVISEGLRLLQEREHKLDALRMDIQSGLDQLERSEGIVISDEKKSAGRCARDRASRSGANGQSEESVMMRRFRISPDALTDLDQIWDYIATSNPTAATRLVDRLTQHFEMLARQPLIGEARNELATALRDFLVGNYVIYYRPVE